MSTLSKGSHPVSSGKAIFFGLFGLVVIVAAGIFALPQAQAVTGAPTVYVQAGDGGGSAPPPSSRCNNQVGALGANSTDDDDLDCARVQLVNASNEVYNQDFRLCFYVQNSASCTPWASEGGGSGPVVIGGNSLTYLGMNVESRALPSQLAGTTFSDVGAGIQLFYRSNGGACGGSSGTVFSYGNGALSSWAYGAGNDDDPGCGRATLSVSIDSPYSAAYVSSTLAGASMPASSPRPGFNVVMQNTGHFWPSDQVVSQNGNCDDYTPGPGAGTCQYDEVYTSSTIQLQRLNDGVPVNLGSNTFSYRRSIHYTYSSHHIFWVETECSPIDQVYNPPKTWLADLWHKIVPIAYALPVGDCTRIVHDEWVTEVDANGSPSVSAPDSATFDLPGFTAPSTPGTYTLQFRMIKLNGASNGTYPDGTFEQTANINFTVTGGSDFILSCAPPTQTVEQGTPASYTVTATAIGSFSGQVSAQVTGGLGTGMGANTVTINVPPGGASSSSIIVSSNSSTPPATYPLTITGSSSGFSNKTCSVQLQVIPAPGGNGPIVFLTSTTSSVNNPSQLFDLTWTPSNATSCDISANPDNPGWVDGQTRDPSAGPHTQTGLSISVTTTFTITCNKPGFDSSTANVTVALGTSGISCTVSGPLTFSATEGAALPASQSFTLTNTGSVDLEFYIFAEKTWLTVETTVVQVPVGQQRQVPVHPNTTTGLTPNPDTARVIFDEMHGAPVCLTSTATYTLRTFALNCSNITPSPSQSVMPGGSASWTVPYTSTGDLANPIDFNITHPPSSTSFGSSTSPPAPPPPTSGSRSVLVTTGTATAPSTYNLTITAQSGSIVKTCPVTLVVTGPPTTFDFTCTATRTVQAGGGTTYTVTTRSLNPATGQYFVGTVNVSVAGLPNFASSPGGGYYVGGGDVGSADIPVSTTTSTPTGTYQLIFTATAAAGSTNGGFPAAGQTATCNANLIVTSPPTPPSFSLDCANINPVNPSVTQGGTMSWNVPYTTSGGWSLAINFTINPPIPTGASVISTTTSQPPPSSGTQSVGLDTDTTTPAGNYDLTVRAHSGSIVRTCPITLLVKQDATATMHCSTDGTNYTSGANPPIPTCDPVEYGTSGYLRWSSTAAASCSMNQPLLNYSSPAPSPPAPVSNYSVPTGTLGVPTNPLTTLGTVTFTLTCVSNQGGADGISQVRFNVIPGEPDMDQSKKSIVCVTSGTTKTRFMAGLCPGAPSTITPLDSYLFKAGDIATFVLQIKNTGTADLDMSGRTLTLTDTLSNLVKPPAPGLWNVTYECGNDCVEQTGPPGQGYVDDSTFPPVIKFRFTGKSGPRVIPAVNGIWSVTYDAMVQTPPAPAQPPFRFFNCATSVFSPSAGVSIPQLCLDNPFLFVPAGPGAPDRHEIAP